MICLVVDSVEVHKDVAAKLSKPVKAQRLIALQYNFSDSENEETREERKARIVSTKENKDPRSRT